jgi:hypothetical protein
MGKTDRICASSLMIDLGFDEDVDGEAKKAWCVASYKSITR